MTDPNVANSLQRIASRRGSGAAGAAGAHLPHVFLHGTPRQVRSFVFLDCVCCTSALLDAFLWQSPRRRCCNHPIRAQRTSASGWRSHVVGAKCATWSQWDDPTRPWVGREAEVSARLLRGAGLPLTVRKYFRDQKPSLAMHFRVLQDFCPQA